jgi:hypothetical protein
MKRGISADPASLKKESGTPLSPSSHDSSPPSPKTATLPVIPDKVSPPVAAVQPMQVCPELK